MTNGIFKTSEDYGYARAINIMSTQSPVDFGWSVKLVAGWGFDVGVASRLKCEDSYIAHYDQNAIIYHSSGTTLLPEITVGSHTIYEQITIHQMGDTIHFKFQPHAKKLLIDLVKIWKSS